MAEGVMDRRRFSDKYWASIELDRIGCVVDPYAPCNASRQQAEGLFGLRADSARAGRSGFAGGCGSLAKRSSVDRAKLVVMASPSNHVAA